MTGSELIAAERVRQVAEEGYDSTHDVGRAVELADAAASYALADLRRGGNPPPMWPWDRRYWKPTPDDRTRELVKAGALIAAAIDALAQEGETR